MLNFNLVLPAYTSMAMCVKGTHRWTGPLRDAGISLSRVEA